jgi:pimeloyl-ACP methyl ester carboxylesterase
MSDRRFGVQDAALDDLGARLQNTRWSSVVPGRGWERGADLEYLRELVDYWQTSFDWRAQESALSGFTHERVHVPGISLHQIHQHVPNGVTIFPKDMVPAPRQFAERFFRIVRWTELRAGGHFTAWEEPEAFARELNALARDVVPETSHG